MKIVLFGATGMIGSRIARELERRGHDVVAATRSTGVDATDPASVAAAVPGADAVVSAISARGVDYTLADVGRSLVQGLRRAGVRRLLVVGGAASLEVAPGLRLIDTPDFKEEWKAEARRDDLLKFLEARFTSPLPEDLVAAIAATMDLDKLSRWVIAAGKANSLAAFRQAAAVQGLSIM